MATLTRARFEALVGDAQARALRDLPGFHREAALLTWTGHGLLAAALAVSVVVALGGIGLVIAHPSAISVKIALVGLIFGGSMLWAVAAAMFARHPAPEGRVIRPDEAPALFAAIAAARRAADGPPIHRVVLTPEFNAAMAQVPRFGVLGGFRNHLVLGLPLLDHLDPDEALSVVAHEIGHAGGGHGRSGSRMYRMRDAWARIAPAMHGSWILRWTVLPLWNLLWPRLSAWGFVMSRLQEHEADRAGVRVAGPAAARALLRVAVAGRAVGERFWGALDRRMLAEEQPPASPTGDMAAAAASVAPDERRSWLAEAWREPTGFDDTHPCLRERVEAMGAALAEPPAERPGPSAADQWLGAALPGLRREIDGAWIAGGSAAWSARRTELRALAERRDRVAAQPPDGRSPADVDVLLQASELLGEPAGRRATAERLVAEHPRHAGARFVLGRQRLADGDRGGLDDLEEAVRMDPDFRAPASDAVLPWLRSRGLVEESSRWLAALDGFEAAEAAAQQERSVLPKTDRLRPPTMDPEAVARLHAALAVESGLDAAALVRVEVRHQAHRPWHVLVLTPRRWRFQRSATLAAIRDRVLTAWSAGPAEGVLSVVMRPDARAIARKAERIDPRVWRRR
jgi:Zn-dependent protease with chaperone function